MLIKKSQQKKTKAKLTMSTHSQSPFVDSNITNQVIKGRKKAYDLPHESNVEKFQTQDESLHIQYNLI